MRRQGPAAKRVILDAARIPRKRANMSGTLAAGTIFARRYRILRCIAAGGMGAVYEAVHLETDRSRALKVMHPHIFQSDDMRERFKREARIAAHIESEHIVDVSDAGVDETTGMPFLVMELLRGEDLSQRLRHVGHLAPAEVLSYLQQIALALDRTHAASIVHRDLKPENLFLTQREDGSPRMKILDFGVAKLIAEGATAAGVTRNLGTPLYMAPEQFRAGTSLTGAADIYALGMVAYTLLVGQPYWSREAAGAGDVIALAMAVIRGVQEPPVQRAAASGISLPPAFDAWFAQVAATEPKARFRTATEAILALRDVLGGIPGAGLAVTAPLPAITPDEASSVRTVPLPLAMPAGAAHAVPESSGPHPPGRTAASTEAGVSVVSRPGRRGPAVATVMLLNLGVLGALGGGTWWLLRSRSAGSSIPEASTGIGVPVGIAPPVAPVATSSAAAPVASPSAWPVAIATAPAASASSGTTSSAPRASTGAEASARAPVKAASKQAAPAQPPVTAPSTPRAVPRDVFEQD